MNEQALFIAALPLDPASRRSYLDRECAGNDTLRQRVERLLSAYDQAGSFLDHTADLPTDGPAADGATGTFPADAPLAAPIGETADYPGKDEHVGAILGGKYKLIEEIGEGGMGSVYMAQQTEPVKRAVAVKVIKAGMDSKAVLARFEAERQALAMMDHPNIARVLDAGTTESGRPYFVMELVKGVPITQFCDERKLTPKQRLELFVPVCNAIQHAHMKGIIHRDIKPSNVLVAMYDDRPVPKVIDFGVAKAAGQTLTDKTLMTGFGAVVGTPEYMSPEQANLNNLDIDTRSDVYSLGVLLYELLTGHTPVDRKSLGKAALLEILRIVREVEAPKPSQKLSSSESLPSVAANRNTEPAKLSKLMQGELDWVLLKALEKDRARRYESANGFAADVQRYLADEVVEARPPSTGYRLRKFVKRHKVQVIAASLVFMALLVGITGTTLGFLEARREQAKTKDALELAERHRDQAELTLVRSYLRPIGFKTDGVDEAELIALDELSQQEDRVKLLFLREALAHGERALRIALRAERVVQAAVGPSLNRRAIALELMSATQRNKDADPRSRLSACWIAIELGSDDLPALSEGFDTLLTRKILNWNNIIPSLSRRIRSSKEMACVESLLGVMKKTTDLDTLWAAGDGLATLAPQLDPTSAKYASEALMAILGKATNSTVSSAACRPLVGLAPRLDPATAKSTSDALVAFLAKSPDGFNFWAAGNGLSALAPRLDPEAAKSTFDALLTVLVKAKDGGAISAAGDGLAALTPRLNPTAAKSASDALVAILGKAKSQTVMFAACKGLAGLAGRLDPAAGKSAFEALVAVLGKTTDSFELYIAGDILTNLALRLDPTAAKSAFEALVAVLGKTTDMDALITVAHGFATLATRLDPAAAKSVFEALVALLGKTTDSGTMKVAGDGLAALAPRLDPATVKSTFDTLLTMLGMTTSQRVSVAACKAITSLAPRLDPVAAKSASEVMLAILGKTTDGGGVWDVGEALEALAPQLEPATAKAACHALITIIDQTADEHVSFAACKGLVALARRLDTPRVKSALDTLVTTLGKYGDGNNLVLVGHWFAVLAPRLDAMAAKSAHVALVATLGKTTHINGLLAAGEGLAALAPRLDPATATSALDALQSVCESAPDTYAWHSAGEGLAALAPSFNSAQCYKVINHLLAASRTNVRYSIYEVTLAKLLRSIDSPQLLTELLRDPACHGITRDVILLRLEELAYPQPVQAAVFAGLGATPSSPLVVPILAASAYEHRRQNRRFRTVSDAAQWIAKHHPEIDLDSPYHK